MKEQTEITSTDTTPAETPAATPAEATDTPATTATPTDPEAIQARLHSLKSDSLFSLKAALMATATRNAKCDLDEANAKLDLLKLENNPEVSNDDKDKLKQQTLLLLENIQTIRKLGKILDGLQENKAELDKILAPAKQAADEMAAMEALAAPLETKITALRARDIRGQEGELGLLEDQSRWALEVYHAGKWRGALLDYRDLVLADELESMSDQGKYKGEFTKEGLEARYEELQPLIEEWKARWENSLSSSEMHELAKAERELGAIQTQIQDFTEFFNDHQEKAQNAGEIYDARYEAALIGFEIAMEVHRIHCEMIETSHPE